MDVLRRANELETDRGLSDDKRPVLHCEVGQPQTGAPSGVVAAASAALSLREKMGYTDAFGLVPLREKIAAHYKSHYGLAEPVDVSRIVVTTGSSGGFLLMFTACFDAGDSVAVASSGYPCYRNILQALGCKVATIKVNDEFKITATELQAEIKRRNEAGNERIKGLVLSSPSNPTGAMLDPKELEELCGVCDEHGIWFLSDEIYHGISYGKGEATALSFSKNVLVINSFSKYYSMSGWRLGWLVLPESLVEPINILQQNMFINAPTISQTGAMACWDDDTLTELESHVEVYGRAREVILAALSSIPEIDPKNIAPADGGFYVYVDLGSNIHIQSGLGSEAFCSALLEEEFVAFTPGTDFEDPESDLGDRRFRISYAGGVETASEAMERLKVFWDRWLIKVAQAQASP
uniref:Aminotransferase class I/classII large domain-containing protein n=2 Tax=Corethron hystrix TaxID=216773 RepID=A0A7S1BCS6_9STRA